MKEFYIVKVNFFVNSDYQEKLLVAKSEDISIESKVRLYFQTFDIKNIEIFSTKKSTIAFFLGNPEADKLYVSKIRFIGTNIAKPKQRTIAVGANSIQIACKIIDNAFEDIQSIKKLLLSELQLKTIEYNSEIEYIDYEIDEIVRSEMSFIQ